MYYDTPSFIILFLCFFLVLQPPVVNLFLISPIVLHLGGWLHHALRVLLQIRQGRVRTGGRLPPLSGTEDIQADLRTGERDASGDGNRKGHFQPHGFHHPPQPRTGDAQRGADEPHRFRADQSRYVGPVDTAQHRHGQGRAVAAEADFRTGRAVCRQGDFSLSKE